MDSSKVFALSQEDETTYAGAINAAHFYVNPEAGYLRLVGETRVDFLQRQTTNDLRLLTPDHALVTILTSPTARILDVLLLVDEGEAIGIVPLPGRLDATARFLRSRIFFMDKVKVEDSSLGWGQVEIGGVGSPQALEALGVSIGDAPGDTARVQTPTGEIAVIRVARRFPGDYLLSAGPNTLPHIVAALTQAGAVELTAGVHELFRIENGLPGASIELSEDYTPLEAGLDDAIAQEKGCYTGQEIIARQLTYDKVIQRLVGLKPDAPVSFGDGLYSGERRVGVVTSAAISPRHGLIALGYVHRPEFEVGQVLCTSPDNGASSVTIIRLPLNAEQKKPPV